MPSFLESSEVIQREGKKPFPKAFKVTLTHLSTSDLQSHLHALILNSLWTPALELLKSSFPN